MNCLRTIRALGAAALLLGAAVASAQSSHQYLLGRSRSQVDQDIVDQRAAGRELVDIERRRSPQGVLSFDLIFAPLPGVGHVSALIDVDEAAYDGFLAQIQNQAGRVLDLEVDEEGGAWRFSLLFWPGSSHAAAREIRSRRQRQDFLDLVADRARSAGRLVDIEATVRNGQLYFSGVWQTHAGQPQNVLHVDLLRTDLDVLARAADASIAPGAILDIERYRDPADQVERFAVLLAPLAASGERLSTALNLATLNSVHVSIASAGNHAIDIDRYYDAGGNPRYDVLWGPSRAPLGDVPALRHDDQMLATGGALQALIDGYDAGNPRRNALGLFAMNLRTRTSVGHRADELFPLASLVKLPIAARLLRDADVVGLNLDTSTERFTSGSASFDPHWVDDRLAPGLGCGDRGQTFSLRRAMQGMLTVSDNATTGMLLLREDGLARQALSINDWLAGLAGIGQGFGPILAIGELDRLAAGAGQGCPASICKLSHPHASCRFATAFASSSTNSLLAAQTWRIELALRGSGESCGTAHGQALADFYAPAPVPDSCFDHGLARFQDGGHNAATPRALGLLHEALANGQLLSAQRLSELFAAMGEFDVLDGHPDFPDADEVYSKGGTKGDFNSITHTVTDSALLRIGPDWFTLVAFAKHSNIDDSLLRSNRAGFDYPELGLLALRRIAPDLLTSTTLVPNLQSASQVQVGDPVAVQLRVRNAGPVAAGGFRLALHASPDASIDAADPLLGTLDTSALAAGGERTLLLSGNVPAGLAPGSYRVGWRIDVAIPGLGLTVRNGQVGESDERSASNHGLLASSIVVAAGAGIFANGFE